jgi:hypothetical protein
MSMQTERASDTQSKTKRLRRFCSAFVAIVGLCVAVTWIARSGHSSGPATLNLTISPDATFKFFRQVHRDGKYAWIGVPVRPETAHEIIRLLQGAEPYVVESRWGFQWDWPPVHRAPGHAGTFAPDNGLLEVYEGESNEPSLRVGFLVIEQRVAHALLENAGRYFFPEQYKARLFALLGPLVDEPSSGR